MVTLIADDHPGALLELLTEFAVRGVNLTRIESRPTGHGLGRYCFSIDCEGHIEDARVGDALAALHRFCEEVRFCGSYPRADGEAPRPAREPRTATSRRPRSGWTGPAGRPAEPLRPAPAGPLRPRDALLRGCGQTSRVPAKSGRARLTSIV